jgi:hypothetical protein
VARALDQFSDKIASATSFFIKPNLVSKEPYPTITDPQLLDTVLESLSDHTQMVGDGPAFDAPLNAFFNRKTRGVTTIPIFQAFNGKDLNRIGLGA